MVTEDYQVHRLNALEVGWTHDYDGTEADDGPFGDRLSKLDCVALFNATTLVAVVDDSLESRGHLVYYDVPSKTWSMGEQIEEVGTHSGFSVQTCVMRDAETLSVEVNNGYEFEWRLLDVNLGGYRVHDSRGYQPTPTVEGVVYRWRDHIFYVGGKVKHPDTGKMESVTDIYYTKMGHPSWSRVPHQKYGSMHRSVMCLKA